MEAKLYRLPEYNCWTDTYAGPLSLDIKYEPGTPGQQGQHDSIVRDVAAQHCSRAGT